MALPRPLSTAYTRWELSDEGTVGAAALSWLGEAGGATTLGPWVSETPLPPGHKGVATGVLAKVAAIRRRDNLVLPAPAPVP